MDVNGDLMNGTRYEQMDSLPMHQALGISSYILDRLKIHLHHHGINHNPGRHAMGMDICAYCCPKNWNSGQEFAD